MADKNQIIIEMKAKIAKFEKDLGKARKAVDKTKKSSDRMRISTSGLRRSIGALRNNMLLVSFALGGTLASVNKLIKAYGEQQLAEKKLSSALGFTSQALLTQASALQQTTVFGDEAIIGVQALIGAFTKDEEKIKELTKATLDLAAAKGMDLKAAADLVSKSFGSSTNALSRYGIQVEGAVGSTERLESLTGNVSALFGGQAAAEANTMTGAIKQMENAAGDTAEAMGALLAPSVEKLTTKMKKAAEWATNLFTEFKETDWETFLRELRELGVSEEDLFEIDAFVKLSQHQEQMLINNKAIFDLLAKEGEKWKKEEHKRYNDQHKRTQFLTNEELRLLGVKVDSRTKDEKFRKRFVSLGDMELVTSEKIQAMLDSRAKQAKEILETSKVLSDEEQKKVSILSDEADFLLQMLLFTKRREEHEKSIAGIGKDAPDAPLIPTDYDLFIEQQQKRLDNHNKEQGFIELLQSDYPELADSLKLYTDAQKEDIKAQEERTKGFEKERKAYEKWLETREKNRKKERERAFKDSADLGRLAVKDSNAARNAAIDKIFAYAMTASAKQMEKIITKVPFPYNIPASIAGGLVVGAAVGGLADNLKAAQYGMNEVVDEPTMILAGEAGAEQVSITPLESPNIDGVQGGGASVVVNVSGNVLTSDYVEGELADNIREAVRRGTDFGIG